MPSDLRGDSRRERRPDLIALAAARSICRSSPRKRGPRTDSRLRGNERRDDSPPASPPSSARRRAAPFSPACIIIAATSRAGSGSWPSSASALGAPLVAVNDVPITRPSAGRSPICVTCIREKCTLAEAGLRLAVNAERHLKPPEEMARLFKNFPDAIARTVDIAKACRFSLGRTEIRISRRAGAGRQNRPAASCGSHLGGRARALSRKTNIRTAFRPTSQSGSMTSWR